MPYSCEIDDEARFFDYRERIVVSEHPVTCCETRIEIPAGIPYAECQGVSEMSEHEWDTYPQALEVWRFLRNLKQREGHCFCFSSTEEEMEWIDVSDYLFKARWQSLQNRLSARYAQNKRPRLHPWEQIALETGEWFDWIQFPSGGMVFELSADGAKRIPIPPPTPAGAPWKPQGWYCPCGAYISNDEDYCPKCGNGEKP